MEIMGKSLAMRRWLELQVIVTGTVMWIWISALGSEVDTAVLKMN